MYKWNKFSTSSWSINTWENKLSCDNKFIDMWSINTCDSKTRGGFFFLLFHSINRKEVIRKNMKNCVYYQFRSVQLLSCVRLFAIPWTAACQASLSISNSQSLLKLMSIELVMPSNHLTFNLIIKTAKATININWMLSLF